MKIIYYLKDIEGISIHNFSDKDVVRHKLVQQIILAYDKYEKERKENKSLKSVNRGNKK